MPKGPNQKRKLFVLYQLFCEKTDRNHGLTMEQILDALAGYDISAERKSIYDDIETLRLCGVDIRQNRSSGKVDYRLVQRDFDPAELKLLVDAVQSSRFITREKSIELIRKVEKLASTYDAGTLHRQVHLSNRPKTVNANVLQCIDDIHNAIAAGVKIRFRYFEWVRGRGRVMPERRFRRDGAAYVVSPIALVWDDENYYLVGFDDHHNQLRHYRVDRMERPVLSDEPRSGMNFSDFDVADYTKKTFSMFGGEEVQVEIRFSDRLIGVVTDRFGQDVFLCPDRDGWFTVTVNVVLSPQFYSWLFSFGTEAQILAPQSAVDAFRTACATILAQYQAE